MYITTTTSPGDISIAVVELDTTLGITTGIRMCTIPIGTAAIITILMAIIVRDTTMVTSIGTAAMAP
ncbi:Fc.00g001860.m01.CDS01 [Cosmosporella sp. VM-42]